MILSESVAPPTQILDAETVRQTLALGLAGRHRGEKVLVLIPDHTRTTPLPQLFRFLVETLHDVRRLDFMVALGTHPSLSDDQLCQLVGISTQERQSTYRHVGLLNHAWDRPDSLVRIGVLTQAEMQALAGDAWHPSLGGDVPVNVNRETLGYDHIIILGPTLPHEVAGFSGGAKYLFPGVSGPEMINTMHWLGALVGVIATAGVRQTAVRAMVHAAVRHFPVPITLVSLVVVGEGLAGMFVGDHTAAWEAAADLSAERHILWHDRPFRKTHDLVELGAECVVIDATLEPHLGKT